MVTDLPEMAAIVNQYKIGEVTASLNPNILAEKITNALFSSKKQEVWQKNLEVAAKELIWENEEIVLKDIFSGFLMKP